jgi:hypothetical protein
MELMKAMGVDSGRYEPMPTDQITTFESASYEPSHRVLAWVRRHTICFDGTPGPERSSYCVDRRGNKLQQKDCAQELDLDVSIVSRHMRAWERRGLIKLEKEGRICLRGKVVPVEIETSGEYEALPTSLREALESLDVPARQTLHDEYLAWQVRRREETAAAMAIARKQSDQELAQLMLAHGLSKVGRRWTVAVQQVNPSPDTPGAADSDSAPSCSTSNLATAEMASGSSTESLVQQLSPRPNGSKPAAPDDRPVRVQQVNLAQNGLGATQSSGRGGDRKNGIPAADAQSSDGPAKYASDRDELVALMTHYLGHGPDGQLVRDIVEMVEAKRGKTLREYLDDVFLAPKGPGQKPRVERLRHPPREGFFRDHAEKFGSSLTRTAPAPRKVDSAHPALGKKCQNCLGRGRLPSGDYCQCQMGKDMRIADSGRAKAKTKEMNA